MSANPMLMFRDLQTNTVGRELPTRPAQRSAPRTDKEQNRAKASGSGYQTHQYTKDKGKGKETEVREPSSYDDPGKQGDRQDTPSTENTLDLVEDVAMESAKEIEAESRTLQPPQVHSAPMLSDVHQEHHSASRVLVVKPAIMEATGPVFKHGPKESILIKLLDEATIARFNVKDFLCNTDITLKFGQLLDRSPQIRAQLTRYLQAKVPSRKGRRKPINTMAVV